MKRNKIQIKPGVQLGKEIGGKFVCITPEMLSATYVVADAYYQAKAQLIQAHPEYADLDDFTITSVCDGKHMKGSKHYEGNAIDIRTRFKTSLSQMPKLDKLFLAKRLKHALGKDYDVVIENTHIHIERDPEE